MVDSPSALLVHSVQTVVCPTAVAIGTLPLAVLVAFILRTATVTERISAITPFTPPEQERSKAATPSATVPRSHVY